MQSLPRDALSPRNRPTVAPQQSFAYGSAGRPSTSSRLRADVPVSRATTAIESSIANAKKSQPSQLNGQVHDADDQNVPGKDSLPLDLTHSVPQRRTSALRPTSAETAAPGPENSRDSDDTKATVKNPPRSYRGSVSSGDFGIEGDIGGMSAIARIKKPPPPYHDTEDWFIPNKSQVPLIAPQRSYRQRSSTFPWANLGRALSFGLLLIPAVIVGYHLFGFIRNDYKTVPIVTPDIDSPISPDLNAIRDRLDLLEDRYKLLQFSTTNPVPSRRINYFSTGLGAIIDPLLTSPTRRAPRTLMTWFITRWYSLPLRESPPPAEALGAWDDIGDCWCTPPTPAGGKAQLAVILPRMIIPTQLVVEHIPRDATLDIGAAPQGIELWIPVADRDKREALAFASLKKFGEDEESIRFSHRKGSKSLDDTWVRIGTWRYDIFITENVQTFNIDIRLESFGVVVNKVAVRVYSNWGTRDYVCLYRLKLHGLLAEEDHKYMDTAPMGEF